ncbi:hypothetical protein QMK47_04885 [Pseudomonas sp. P9_35]|uniref:hypothetical protein n=2 Tax=Pseudomonas TaxID=286 RepID=UPI002A3699FE|nr:MULTISPECIES: hypothetical protein [unclassified Pseudomonas]WPN64336.1 hypothetical protein QMK48_03985 [Pseudomonas sp. P9_32]WPN70087.1 hypothetical protein QMK47_04885 [Pseudomonas sp. P9_35]
MDDSIRNIDELPSIERVKYVAQGLALLDAIIMPEWEYRYFSFNCNWDGAGKEMMGSMRDGSGGEYFLHFTSAGVAGKVIFGSPLSDVPGCLNTMPEAFQQFKVEPAFSADNASLFFWRGVKQPSWCASPDGLKEYPLLNFLVEGIEAYKALAKDYYEKNIDAVVLEEVFASLNVTADQLMILNPNIELGDLADDFQEILGHAL